MSKTCFLVALILFAGLGVLLGCGGSSKTPENPSTRVDPQGDWWNNPGVVQDRLAAIGASPFLNNVSSARIAAETNARAALAATLKAKIQQLVENWSKEAGDLNIAKSLSSYINNETFTRQFVDTEISGARAHKYHLDRDTNTQYVLMILDTEKAQEWLSSVGNALSEQALRDATLFKTEAMKSQARDRLDSLIDKEKKQAEEATKAIMKATLGGA